MTKKLRHNKERVYGTMMYVAGIIVWPLIILGMLHAITGGIGFLALRQFIPMLFYIAAFLLFVFIERLLMRAYIFGHYVLVGPNQFPHLHDMVTQSATKIGLRRVPTTFVHNSSGVMNAMAVRLFGGRYVWLTSALRDADTDSQVRFVLGHELGHHAFGHLDRWRNLLKLPGHFVPFLGVAYSRSRELSCDRMAAYMANDLDSSLSALQMLACGSARLNSQMNPAAFQDQERLIPPVTGFILNLFSGYLRITKRVASVANFFGTSYPASREGGFGNDGDNGRVLLGARSEPSLSAKT